MQTDLRPSLLILGKGEIARALARLAVAADYPVKVMEADADNVQWPPQVQVEASVYTNSPTPLAAQTHAVVARGHEGDAESVASLLSHGAERVYLIASAHRAVKVVEAASEHMDDPSLLDWLSAPAGLDLGGKSSEAIALAILAEIQLRHYGGSGRVLTDLREERAAKAGTVQEDAQCPGKRQ